MVRIVSDPTFDEAGPHGYLTKTAGPAVDEDGVGPVDLVPISHDTHPDNLDERGRAFAKTARLVLGTGVFGGFTPLIALSLTTSTGNQLAGVAYPIATAAMSALVSLMLLRKGRDNRLVRAVWDQFGTPERTGEQTGSLDRASAAR
ncbi:hypothetical protein [Streptomyces antimycoticus]|uniref:hypothetical protein n=1 Tax=Streptomyces antimycoticus TaxID=68175 RepID=UPI003F4DDDFE